MVLCILSGIIVILCNMLAQAMNEQIDPRIRAKQMTEESEVVRAMRICRHQEAVFPGNAPREYKETEVSDSAFRIVGIQKPEEAVLQVKRKWYQGRPILFWAILLLIPIRWDGISFL